LWENIICKIAILNSGILYQPPFFPFPVNFRSHTTAEPKGFLIAPMVDILLVLLGFFMLTWTFSRYETELDVQVPTAHEGKEVRRSPGEVIINVKADGSIIMNRHTFSPEELTSTLTHIATLYPDQAIILRGDTTAPYNYIIQVLDICRSANIWNVAFATSQASAPPTLPVQSPE
jgi:biopolymer transport protein ExbD